MAAWTRKLVSDLDKADETARRLLERLSQEQLNWRPTEEAWSIGQCLDHLCATNDVYLTPIAAALEGKPRQRVEEITPGWFGRLFLKKVIEPSAESIRAKAPSKIVPAPRVDDRVLERFLRGNEKLRELIAKAREYDVNRIRFKNPFVPLLRFTVGTGFVIVTRHQHRHLLQAERVKSSDGFPK